jgi:hypothetical protein
MLNRIIDHLGGCVLKAVCLIGCERSDLRDVLRYSLPDPILLQTRKPKAVPDRAQTVARHGTSPLPLQNPSDHEGAQEAVACRRGDAKRTYNVTVAHFPSAVNEGQGTLG